MVVVVGEEHMPSVAVAQSTQISVTMVVVTVTNTVGSAVTTVVVVVGARVITTSSAQVPVASHKSTT